jgi:hypothetical protein
MVKSGNYTIPRETEESQTTRIRDGSSRVSLSVEQTSDGWLVIIF